MSTPLSIASHTVSSVDPDASLVPFWEITGAVWVSLGATCSIANGAITFRIVFTDAAKNVTGVSPAYTLTAGPNKPDYGALWLGNPPPDSPLPALSVCADRISVKTDAITGTWCISIQSFTPPPVSA